MFQGFSGIKKRPRVEWWCATTGDGTGEVRVHRKPYALAEGNVFVISTKNEVVVVEQMEKNLSGLEGGAEVLKSFKTETEELKNLTPRDEKKKASNS